MQRVTGAVLILTATCGAGYVYCRELRLYLERMTSLRYVMSLIRGEIAYTRAPLTEVFAAVARKVKEPYRTWLLGTAKEMEAHREQGFPAVWSRAVGRYLEPLELKREHRLLLKEAGSFLGSLEKDTLDRTFALYLERMDRETEKLREGLAAKTRIGGCLGVMSGIFLIVILL